MTKLCGLTEAEARQRLEAEGLNEIGARKPRGLLPIEVEIVREPMFVLLVASGSVYLLIGSLGDALMLLGFVLVVMAIAVIQERLTERALEVLRELSRRAYSPHCHP